MPVTGSAPPLCGLGTAFTCVRRHDDLSVMRTTSIRVWVELGFGVAHRRFLFEKVLLFGKTGPENGLHRWEK